MTSRRELEQALEAWGDEAVPEPSPLFLARLERDLVAGDGAVEVAIEPGTGGRVVPMRRRAGLTAVAVAAVVAVAGSAAALGVFRPEGGGVRVEPGAEGTEAPLPVGPSTSTPPITEPSTTAPSAPTVSAGTEPASTSTTTPVESTTTVAVTVGSEPSTSVAVVTTVVVPAVTEPPSTRPTEPPATTAPPPTTTAPTTTRATEPPPTITFSATCAVGVVDTRTAIVCEWTEPPGGAASYRILRGDQQAAVGRVLYPSPANARRYVDHDVVAGHTYSFLIHALNADGTKTGQSDLVIVPCCTV